MTEPLFKRSIPMLPGWSIDRNGHVYDPQRRVETLTMKEKNGLQCRGVEINGEKFPVWKLIQLIWSPGKKLFTRSGDLMDYRTPNIFTFVKLEAKTRIEDQLHQQVVWYHYRYKQRKVSELREATGMLEYDEEDMLGLIKGLVFAEIRR